MARLQLALFCAMLAVALALGAAPAEVPGSINLAQGTAATAATAPAKPFFDPLLMYNPYM